MLFYNLDLDAGAHGCGQHQVLHVGSLDLGRTCLQDRVEDRVEVFHQLAVIEGYLADQDIDV